MTCDSLVGLELCDAITALDAENAAYTIVTNDSDKQKAWDAELVVRAVATDGGYELTTSKFLLKVQ